MIRKHLNLQKMALVNSEQLTFLRMERQNSLLGETVT
jgi:hypothetical protein